MAILIFSVDKNIYGLNVEYVQEIIANNNLKISETIKNEFMEGIVNVRGTIYTVINMKSIFGIQKEKIDETDGYLVLCSENKFALKVNNVLTIVSEENLEIKSIDNIDKMIEDNMFETAFQYENNIGLLIDNQKLMSKIHNKEDSENNI